MIALDTSAKLKKSPKKPLVQVPVAKGSEESDSEDLEGSDVEEAGTDSPNEEIDSRKSVSEDNQSSSGAEGDESDPSSPNEEIVNRKSISDDNQSSSGAEGDESDPNDESNDTVDKAKANPGWADAMQKILNTKKPKRKKTIILSKAKKLNEIIAKPKEEAVPFEVEGEDGEIKKETIKVEDNVAEQGEKNVEKKKRRRKESLGVRVKPSVLNRDRERQLQKIATNGVVQLFNAVRQQQKEIEDKLVEAGPLERKREKALKNIDRQAFLDVLMGGTNNLTVEDNSTEMKEEDEEENDGSNKKDDKVWSVLRDDFVMGANLKDWNKHDSDSEESSAPEEMDSD